MRRHHRLAPCKVNLLLNILGRRADGFHELETVLHPVPLHDELEFERGPAGLELTCGDPRLPVDTHNLVHRAASAFLAASGISDGVRIHLEKRIPMEAGLGGGSGDAAHTLLGLNALFDEPLAPEALGGLAATLGSDVVFFLQPLPALATGRGECVEWIEPFAVLEGRGLLLVHPGFGVSTPWAYRNLAHHPQALSGQAGRARQLIDALRRSDLHAAAAQFFNALEAPVLGKYPLLAVLQEYLLAEGAIAARMSGSGSATFALAASLEAAEDLRVRVSAKFGSHLWTAAVRL